MDRFLGNIDAKVDAKGRVFVPAVFRKNLEVSENLRLILRKDIHQDCLVLYPENIWNNELDLLRSKLNKWDAGQQQLFRQFVLDAEILEMDSNGRILIPKRYMQLAGISTDIRFLGMDFTIEIWAKEKLEKSLLDADIFKQGIQKWMSNEHGERII